MDKITRPQIVSPEIMTYESQQLLIAALSNYLLTKSTQKAVE